MKKTILLLAVLLLVCFAQSAPIYAEEDNSTTEPEEESFKFELPIKGTTGYASIKLDVFQLPNKESKRNYIFEAGTSFTICNEKGDYFLIRHNIYTTNENIYGWVEKKYVMVNLPDIIPSIIYYDSNSVSSMFKSSGEALPGITEEKLYNCEFYNPRFEQHMFCMPVLYDMAKQIMTAQKAALKDKNSLKIYETYRPSETQKAVCNSLSNLMDTNADVYNGIASWGKGWFIATGISNHQRGKAMDVSLVKVEKTKKKKLADGTEYTVVTKSKEYKMPTKIHELSAKAVTFQYGVNSNSWKTAPLSKGMKKSEGAKLLQKYCTDAGLTPLASEWWHFDCPSAPGGGKGDFLIHACVSELP